MARRSRQPSPVTWVLAGLAWGAQLAALYAPDPRAVTRSDCDASGIGITDADDTDGNGTNYLSDTGTSDTGASAACSTGGTCATDDASAIDSDDHDSIADAVLKSMPRDADKLVHAVLFAAGTASLVAVGVPWYVAAAGQCAHGWISEKLQAHIPGRGADSVDVVADAAGVAVGTALGVIATR